MTDRKIGGENKLFLKKWAKKKLKTEDRERRKN